LRYQPIAELSFFASIALLVGENMPWDAEHAATILDSYQDCYVIQPIIKKTHRYHFGRGPRLKHIAIARERNEGAVTAYVNAQSVTGNLFAEGKILGVAVTEKYPKGHVGITGDHGIRASVAALGTLNPKENDVLRLDVDSPSAFKALSDWYAGL